MRRTKGKNVPSNKNKAFTTSPYANRSNQQRSAIEMRDCLIILTKASRSDRKSSHFYLYVDISKLDIANCNALTWFLGFGSQSCTLRSVTLPKDIQWASISQKLPRGNWVKDVDGARTRGLNVNILVLLRSERGTKSAGTAKAPHCALCINRALKINVRRTRWKKKCEFQDSVRKRFGGSRDKREVCEGTTSANHPHQVKITFCVGFVIVT